MAVMQKIIECVPNFSEGRNPENIEKIVAPFRGKKDVKLLDYQSDEDHNRMVVTVVGEPNGLKTAVVEAVGCAVDVIDMRTHQGQHPRMGATDVVPFIPIKNVSVEEAIAFSKEIAKEVAQKYSLPIFLYEKSASRPARQNLAHIRKGQFEAMAEKIKQPDWKPDFGPQKNHPSAGVTAMGARMPLVAYNVNLDSSNMEIANEIARTVRHISGGLRYCKGIGIELKDRGQVQVSMNMTDYTRTALYRVFELIKVEARRYGVNVIGSEIVGLVPMEALMDTAAYYLGLENFSMEQVLETRIWE
jgi:glutamate formiminotransferase